MMFTLLLAAAHAQPGWTGAYVLQMDTVTEARIPMWGDMETVTRSTMLASIAPGPEGWVQTHRVCDVRIENDSNVARTVLPRAFIDAMPVVSYPVIFTVDGDDWGYAADMGRVDVGFDPELAGAVPVALEDLGVIDWDGDGSPGATVQIDVPVFHSVDLHVTQRSHAVLTGRVDEDGAIRGAADLVEFEQAVLGASNRLFSHAPTVTPMADRGRFSLRPVPAGTTCASLRAQG